MAQPADTADTHVVKPGETLWGISRRHLDTPLRWPQIQRDNAVPKPVQLRPGQVLRLATRSVTELSGTAWLTRGTQPPQPLVPGARVEPGDTLTTERNTFLSLRLEDGSRVVVPSSSQVRLTSADGRLTSLELLRGRVESYVEKQNERHFEIQTRTGKLGVRGTHFRVRDELGVVTGEVIDGMVQVDVNGPLASTLSLAAGQGALLSGSDAMVAQRLLPPPRDIGTDADTTSAAPVDGANAYRLQIARDDRFQQIFFEARELTPRFTLPASLEPGFYHLRLTAFDAQQIEGLPASHVLFVPVSTGAPTLRSLPDGKIEIRWPARAGQRYDFEIALTPDFTPVLASQPAVDSGGVTAGPFTAPGSYRWRARALDASQPSFGGRFEVPAR